MHCSYNQVLHFDLMKSGIFSVLPWMTMAVTSNIGGWIADKLVERGVTVTRVRKIMQTVRGVLNFTASQAQTPNYAGWQPMCWQAHARSITTACYTLLHAMRDALYHGCRLGSWARPSS